MEDSQLLHLSDSIYSAYGHFAIKFEEVRINIKGILVQILENTGLSNSIYGEIVFANLTAEPLRMIYLSFCAEYFNEDPEDMKITEKISNKFSDAIELRNKLIHAFWALGYGETADETIAVGVRPRLTKKGLDYYDLNFYANDFRGYANQLNLLSDSVYEVRNLIKERIKLTSVINIKEIDDINLICS